MQAGATFALAGTGDSCNRFVRNNDTIRLEADGVVTWLQVTPTELHDYVTRNASGAGVYSTADGTYVTEFHRTRTAVEPSTFHIIERVDGHVRRVARTSRRTFVASDAAVTALDGEPIAMDPIDLTATSDLLAVIDHRGLTVFDAVGAFQSRVSLTDPTAIDHYLGRWLVAMDGTLVTVDSAGQITVVERDVGPIARVRAGFDGVFYTDPAGGLFELFKNTRRQLGSYPAGFTNFVANPFWLDEGNGPTRFYLKTVCGCRTRRLHAEQAGRTGQPDATWVIHERITCPICETTWIEDYPG